MKISGASILESIKSNVTHWQSQDWISNPN